jgi:hypothetical protein
MKAFRVGGFTDEITNCELCGKVELRGTVQMIELDADGNDDTDHYFGTSCAAKAAGWTQKKVKAEVQSIAAKKVAAKRAEEDRVYRVWLAENYGTEDIATAAKMAGIVAHQLWLRHRHELRGETA